jgi:hypothetical protein
MRARVKYKCPVEIKKENREVVTLPMENQIVDIIKIDGENSCLCKTVGFPWVGTFWISRSNLEIIKDM